MADTVPTTALVTDRAPDAFGITWEYSRAIRGGRRIYIAAGETGAFVDAYRRCRQEMRDLGYSYAEPYLGDSFTGTRPCFWMDEARGWSHAALQALRALVPVRIAEAAAREAEWAERDAVRRQEAEARAAREAEAEAGLIERARTEAARSLGSRRWSWVRPQDVEEAEGLIANPGLDAAGARRLLGMVRRAAANVMRTEERVAGPYAPELERARDPAVRAAAAEALAHVTAFDADRARVRNDIGWSRATTLAGHVLTGMGDLDEAAASHAIRILRIHHGQLPGPLLARVLGAPALAAA